MSPARENAFKASLRSAVAAPGYGSQANTDGEDAHFNTYITALRLTVALVIKMNDDFCLAASGSRPEHTS